MRIRIFFHNDFDRICKIARQTFGEFSWTRDELAEYTTHPHRAVRILEVGNSVQGFVLFREKPNKGIKLDLIVVTPVCRRKGNGTKLMQAVMEFEKPIRTYIPEDCLPMQLFLKAVGFRCIRMKADFFLEGDTAFVFKKVPKAAFSESHKLLVEHK